METVAANTTQIDVEYFGYREVIAACLLEGNDELAILDPGPTSSLPGLKRKLAQRGLSVRDLSAILVTHIHLDHAGSTGTLVRENPRLRVYVHERGARHMADPAKLLSSAKRLYGDAMDHMWGEFAAVPVENLRPLAGGEQVHAAGRAIDVIYTPGHASHHVSYMDTSTGTAFVGDTGGLRISRRACVLPLTPPPDIDFDLWRESLRQIRARQPERLFLTHFGAASDPDAHLAQLEDGFAKWLAAAQLTLSMNGDDAARAKQFAAEIGAAIRRKLPEPAATQYFLGSSPEMCWHGLARYLRKKDEAGKSA